MRRNVLLMLVVLIAYGTFAGVKFNCDAESCQNNITPINNTTARPDNSIQCRNERFAEIGETKVCSSIPLHGIEKNGMISGFSTIDDAVLAAAQGVQNKQCKIRREPNLNNAWDPGVGVEVHINGYERNGEYYYGDSYWFADEQVAREFAPHKVDDFSSSNLKHAFSFHNHPNTKIIDSILQKRTDTFSEADIKSAIADGAPSYMMPCYLDGGGTVPRILRFDPAMGIVSARAFAIDANGKIRYAGEWYKDDDETNKAKDIISSGKEIADKIPDLTNLINLLNQSIEHLRKINAMSQKPSEQDFVEYNKVVVRIRKELEDISKAFDEYSEQLNLTLTKKEQMSKKFEETIKPYVDTIVSLMQQIEAKGYGHFKLSGAFGVASSKSQ